MKKILSPIIALAVFFLLFLWLFSTRETTIDITLFGAGYVTLLLAIYLGIINIGNPDYQKMWWASQDLPRESLSDIYVVLYASLPVFIAVVAFFVRRLIVKGKQL